MFFNVQLRRVDRLYATSTNRPTQTSKYTPSHTHTFLQWCGTLCAEEFNVCVCGCYVWVSVWCVGVCGKICASVREISSFTHSIYIYPLPTLSLSFSHWLPDLVIPCLTLTQPLTLWCVYSLCIVQLCWVGLPTLDTLQFICQARF